MLDDKEAIQQLERQRWHGEKIERDDRLAVVLKECQPLLGSVAASVQASQIPRDSPFRDDEAEFLQFAMDLRRSPLRILVRQASDQNSNFYGDSRPAAEWPGSSAPIEAKAGAMPADHSLGFHDDEDIRPATPDARRVVQNSRSTEFKVGRGRLRLSTATCCRSARTAMAVSVRLRKKTPIATRTEKMDSSTNSPF